MKIFKRLFCKHTYEHAYNLYGDQINMYNCRSIYKCTKCGKEIKVQYLNYGGDI